MELLPTRFARTADGFDIAYATAGTGPPLVWLAGLLDDFTALLQVPGLNDFFGKVAAAHTLLFYDVRGFGSSVPAPAAISIEMAVADLDAVITATGLEEFGLIASQLSGPLGLHYAAEHPDRVTQLVLWEAYARSQDFLGDARVAGAGAGGCSKNQR